MQTPSIPTLPASMRAPLVRIAPDGSDPSGILDAFARLRLCSSADEVDAFYADKPVWENPFPDIPDSKKALDLIRKAIELRLNICVYGDYDVDGVSSTTIVYEFLKSAGAKVSTYIPHRMSEDYGLTVQGAANCLEQKEPKVLICVDCASTARGVIADLRTKGVGTIVLDHHNPGDCTDHPAVAHLNPKAWSGCRSIEHAKDYCAGALVFCFVDWLSTQLVTRNWKRARALFYAGMATVVDVMPLTRSNRSFVRASLQIARQREFAELVPGIAALAKACSVTRITESTYGWIIGPHLNAAGRLEHARIAGNLLADFNRERIEHYVGSLIETNRARQSSQKVVLKEAYEQAEAILAKNPDRNFIVVTGKDWHPGVVGIVAGRLKEAYLRPAFVGGWHEDGFWKASGRSVPGCDLGGMVASAVKESVLMGGGGHAMAAGIRIPETGVEALREWLETNAKDPDKWVRVAPVEVLGDLDAYTLDEWLSILDRMGPFGQANPRPCMMASGTVKGSVDVITRHPCGAPSGIKFHLRKGTCKWDLAWFGLPRDLGRTVIDWLETGPEFSAAVSLSLRETRQGTFFNLQVVAAA